MYLEPVSKNPLQASPDSYECWRSPAGGSGICSGGTDRSRYVFGCRENTPIFMNPHHLKSAVVDALACPHTVIEECTAMITVTQSHLGRKGAWALFLQTPYKFLTIAVHFRFPFDGNILEILDSFMYVVLNTQQFPRAWKWYNLGNVTLRIKYTALAFCVSLKHWEYIQHDPKHRSLILKLTLLFKSSVLCMIIKWVWKSSYAHQGCIYLIKNTIKTETLLQFIWRYFKIF